ncbi:MAG: PDZ domain-containing protein [Flexistipes sinusarabici]|uniref:PDZ domain-containing protein n=1 Tax=Flexistipes sinusarabici TaxID=2352 RepID=A0A5D0MKX8_FLESI|nr:trypsin-like peptidase domain-containing protein [Flexistipes sinusarabici]TYB33656.1 MAG: PDZ domain-containing protein [Flexistipes sinusarabici]
MRYVANILLIIFIATQAFASHRVTPVVEAIRKFENTVVNIRTEKIVRQQFNPFFNDPFFDNFFGFNRAYKTQSLGSGFFVKKNGIIVTNYHVTKAANKIFVILNNGKQYNAEIVGSDKVLDLAVLKIKSDESFPVANLGDSNNLYLGETVIAMGNPFGLNSSVTTGVIGSTRRILKVDEGFSVFIQTDALINPGNSGGPLINLDSEVIGINTAIYREAQGIGFSIPVNVLKRVLSDFLKYGYIRKSYTGFQTGGTQDGLKITSIRADSPAEKTGLKKNDIIVQIEGIPVRSKKALKYILRSYPPETTIDIVVNRNKDQLKRSLKLEEFPENYGLEYLKKEFGLVFTGKTSLITVKSTSIPSYIKKGDALISVNNKEINRLSDLNNIVVNNLGGEIVMTLHRGNNTFKIKLEI